MIRRIHTDSLRERFHSPVRRGSGRPLGLQYGLAVAGVGLALLLAGRPACAADIKALPVTIDQPGHYNVNRDLVTSGHAIRITANDVVLDLHGHTISGP